MQTNIVLNQYVLDQDFLITSADVDFEGVLKISALSNILIQSAWQHAGLLGWGSKDLEQFNLAWILSAFQIKIFDYPKWSQQIRCKTWAKGTDRLYYLRDFIVYDERDNIVAVAGSKWLLIDIERRRPKSHNTDAEVLQFNANKHAIQEKIATPKFEGDCNFELDYTVKYSDIDINQHLTTTRYIDLMMDTFDLIDMRKKRPKEIAVNFIKEVNFGEQVKMMRCQNSPNNMQFQLLSNEMEKVLFRAELLF